MNGPNDSGYPGVVPPKTPQTWLSLLQNEDYVPSRGTLLAPDPQLEPVRRKVFISHSHLHESESKVFLREFGSVFIPKHIGLSQKQDRIQSGNPDYVMRCIRGDLIQSQSTVTIVLVGSCTHSRRYVDWEIKASLQQGQGLIPNGLLALKLPSCPNGAIPPPRLELNWRRNDMEGYARYCQYPRNHSELRRWIEEAHASRKTIAERIINHGESMDHNAKCRICGIVHTN